MKFAIGLAIMGLAFLAFIPLAGGGPNTTPLLAMVGILFLFTMAELFLSPTGPSVSTKLAPQVFQTQMVALFLLSISLGTTLAGILAGYYDPDQRGPVLRLHRRGGDHPGRRPGRGRAVAEEADGRHPLTRTATNDGDARVRIGSSPGHRRR